MARKIVQVAAVNALEGNIPYVVAVADDGTAWKIRLIPSDKGGEGDWMRLPDLPSDAGSDDEFMEAIRNPVVG